MRSNFSEVKVVILAAGKGKRMKSSLPKVLHQVCGEAMISIIIDTVKKAGFELKNINVILGYKAEEVRKYLPSGIKTCIQSLQQGTAHALRSASSLWKNSKNVLVLYGDHPLLRPWSLRKVCRFHLQKKADLTLLTTSLSDAKDYGIIIRDSQGKVKAILERTERGVSFKKEDRYFTNPGVMCFKNEVLEEYLPQIKLNKKKREYYLTEIVALLYRDKKNILEVKSLWPEEEGLGVNTFEDLMQAEEIMRKRILEEFLQKDVKIYMPHTVYIQRNVRIGKDTIIYPFTVIEKNVKIGNACKIGPFSHIREGTIIRDKVEIGNFAEIKNSIVKEDTKIKHFCYIGDSYLGKEVNIGAGTVTANFDGIRKYKTIIKDKAFIGSDTVIVAPVKIGKNAKTGAGAVVLKNRDVKDFQTVVGVPAHPLNREE